MTGLNAKEVFLALLVVSLAGCGGSSDNVSPGAIVVEVPVPCEGDDCDDTDNPDTPDRPGEGEAIASVIPARLEAAIRAAGETARDGREIYVIDVGALPGGVLDPDGLLLGNDFVFRIQGGALRVSQN